LSDASLASKLGLVGVAAVLALGPVPELRITGTAGYATSRRRRGAAVRSAKPS